MGTRQVAELTAAEMGSILRLLHELHDFAGTDEECRQHLASGMRALVNAEVGMVASMSQTPGRGSWSIDEFAVSGRSPGCDREEWRSYAADSPMRTMNGRALTRTMRRREHLDDGSWYRLAHSSRLQGLGVDDCIHSVHRVSPSQKFMLACYRAWGSATRFTEREALMVHLLHEELGPIYRRRLPAGASDAETLTPRMSQTLDLLLAGSSEKEAAGELGLSRHTVHAYVRALYRHFYVHTRSELLAQFVVERVSAGEPRTAGVF